eukprot:327199-Hanusia_phi.AAC.12
MEEEIAVQGERDMTSSVLATKLMRELCCDDPLLPSPTSHPDFHVSSSSSSSSSPSSRSPGSVFEAWARRTVQSLLGYIGGLRSISAGLEEAPELFYTFTACPKASRRILRQLEEDRRGRKSIPVLGCCVLVAISPLQQARALPA